MTDHKPKQLLHLVFGGELVSPDSYEFKDLHALDIVGIFASNKAATDAWRAKAHETVDNARMRYFVVHIHKLIEPDQP